MNYYLARFKDGSMVTRSSEREYSVAYMHWFGMSPSGGNYFCSFSFSRDAETARKRLRQRTHPSWDQQLVEAVKIDRALYTEFRRTRGPLAQQAVLVSAGFDL